MRLKWGLGDYVRIGAGFTPFPTEVGVVLKPQSNKTLVLIRGEKKEYPNDGLEYVRPQDMRSPLDRPVDNDEGFSQFDNDFSHNDKGEFVEGAFDEETEFYENPKETTFIDKAKEYGKEILAFIGIAIVIVLVVLNKGEDKKSLNLSIDEEINTNNNLISSYYDLIGEATTEIDKLKIRNTKLMKTKVEVSTN